MKRFVSLLALALFPSIALAQATRVGTGVAIVPRSSAPTCPTGSGCVFIDSSASNALKYKNPAGTIIAIGPGGGGTNLAAAYGTGGSQTDSTMLLDSTRLGVRVWDNSTPISGNLFELASALGTTKYLQVTPTAITVGTSLFSSSTGTDLPFNAPTGNSIRLKVNSADILTVSGTALTVASGKTLTAAASSDLQLNAPTGQFVRLRVNSSDLLTLTDSSGGLATFYGTPIPPSDFGNDIGNSSNRRWNNIWAGNLSASTGFDTWVSASSGQQVRLRVNGVNIASLSSTSAIFSVPIYQTRVRRVSNIIVGGTTTFAGTPSGGSYYFAKFLPSNTTQWRVVVAHRNPKTQASEASALTGWKFALGTPNGSLNGYSGTPTSYTGVSIPANGVPYKTPWQSYSPDGSGRVAFSYYVSATGSAIYYTPNNGYGLFSTSTDPTNMTSPAATGDNGAVGEVWIEYETTSKTLLVWADSIYEGAANVGPPHGTAPGQPATAVQLYCASNNYACGSGALGGMNGSVFVTAANYFSVDQQISDKPDVIFIQEGLNDIGNGQTADQLITTLTQLVQRAWEMGAKQVWLSTIPPAPWFTGSMPAYRTTVNNWVKTAPMGVTVVDEAGLWDTGSNAWVSGYDSGDNTHASASAHSALSAILPAMP